MYKIKLILYMWSDMFKEIYAFEGEKIKPYIL